MNEPICPFCNMLVDMERSMRKRTIKSLEKIIAQAPVTWTPKVTSMFRYLMCKCFYNQMLTNNEIEKTLKEHQEKDGQKDLFSIAKAQAALENGEKLLGVIHRLHSVEYGEDSEESLMELKDALKEMRKQFDLN